MIWINKLKPHVLLLAIISIAAILRFYNIDYQSVWLDEIHTLNEANPDYSFTDVYNATVTGELMPPLYFILVNILFKIFGYSSLVLRLFSGITGILGVFYTYKLGYRLFNKNVGLVAALILSVNIFHIMYSQEGRPYSFLYLFTIISFISLLKLADKPSIKGGIIYGISGVLMLYGHFFAIFILLSQYLFIVILLFKHGRETRIKIFKASFISGIVTLILYIPAFKALMKSAAVKNIWIPQPTPDIYTNLFHEFFGNSEMILPMVYIGIFAYVLKLFKQQEDITQQSIQDNKSQISFILLFLWVVVTITIPLIRSYINVPMIVSRYFIVLLPAVIMMVAAGLCCAKSIIIRNSFLAILCIFSLMDIIVVKKYYNSVTKSQFREVSNYIKHTTRGTVPIVTTLPWYFNYFFENESNKPLIVEGTIDSYVSGMQVNGNFNSFWYIGAHGNKFTVDAATQKVLDEKFYLKNSISLVDAWAYNYALKELDMENLQSLSLENFSPLKSINGSGLQFYENSGTKSSAVTLGQGRYKLAITGNSFPAKPIDGENAHIVVKMNSKTIGAFYLGTEIKPAEPSVTFILAKREDVIFEFIFDNDLAKNGLDRNAIITSVNIINTK